jgi:protease I
LNKNLLIIIPPRNFNEDEYNIIRNYLKKTGVGIFISSVKSGVCTGGRGLKVQTDVLLSNVNPNNFSGIMFVGGSGVLSDVKNKVLHTLADKFNSADKLVAAICAAPLILADSGLLEGIDATCNNKYRKDLENMGVSYVEQSSVQSGNIITSQSPETAKEFAALAVNYISK